MQYFELDKERFVKDRQLLGFQCCGFLKEQNIKILIINNLSFGFKIMLKENVHFLLYWMGMI